MIRSIPLVCSTCGQAFVPRQQLYYKNDPLMQDLRELKLICPACLEAWEKKWQVAEAVFREEAYVLTVTLTLADGTVYPNMDCTALDETETVVTAEDIPEAAQRDLYLRYAAWRKEREKYRLEDCFFSREADGNVKATLITADGERYEDLILYFRPDGHLQAEQALPAALRDELADALKAYEAQEAMFSASTHPTARSGAPLRTDRNRRGRSAGAYGQIQEFGRPDPSGSYRGPNGGRP